jgi:RNA polymerase sigma factor (sigma-70 family)
VSDLPVNRGPTRSLGLMSLNDLRNLPLEDRYATILEYGLEGLTSALQTLDKVGRPVNMDAHRLAWAVAFNIDGWPISRIDDSESERSGRTYKNRWTPDTMWSVIWSTLIKPLDPDKSGHSPTLLSELGLSVACEQREDWQIQSARPIDGAFASRIFEFVYARDRMKVLGFCRRFANGADDADAIADEAWARVFCSYWSTHASRRFHGLSRLSTLVCEVARYISIDTIRNQARFVMNDADLQDEKYFQFAKDTGGASDPSANVMEQQLKLRIRECMRRLPAKRQIVAEMVWLRKISAQRTAQLLRVSEPAISQHLKKARDLVGVCLKEHGFNLPS